MSNSNRWAKEQLQKIYGKGCFFNRGHIAERIEEIGGIKSFRVFKEEKRYKGKPISHQITYHHLVHKSERGKSYRRKWGKCRRNCTSISS